MIHCRLRNLLLTVATSFGPYKGWRLGSLHVTRVRKDDNIHIDQISVSEKKQPQLFGRVNKLATVNKLRLNFEDAD